MLKVVNCITNSKHEAEKAILKGMLLIGDIHYKILQVLYPLHND